MAEVTAVKHLSSSTKNCPQKTCLWLGQTTEAKEKKWWKEVVCYPVSQDSQNLQRAGTSGDIRKRTHQVLKAALNVPDMAGDVRIPSPSFPTSAQS